LPEFHARDPDTDKEERFTGHAPKGEKSPGIFHGENIGTECAILRQMP